MVIVRYYINVVESGKLIAFCKVFFTLFFPIPQHLLSSPIISHYSPTFPFISHYPTTFPIILQHSSLFNIILHHSPFFPFIPYNPTTFDKSTLFFYNIFRQHFFSTTFYIISHTSTKSFFDKKFLSFAVK